MSAQTSKLGHPISSRLWQLSLERNLKDLRDLKLVPPAPVSRSSASTSKRDVGFHPNRHLRCIVSNLTRKYRELCPTKKLSPSLQNQFGLMKPGLLCSLLSESNSSSKDKTGQWFCRHFLEMCVRPTHCTIAVNKLRCWMFDLPWTGRHRQNLIGNK
jgi:hypothetical protein